MKLIAKHVWMLVGATAFVGLAGACSSDDAPVDSAQAGQSSGGKGGQGSSGRGGQGTAGAGKGGQTSGGSGNQAGSGVDQAGSAGDAAGGAPDTMGGAAGEAGSAGDQGAKSCGADIDCSPGICNSKHCAAAECSITQDCSGSTACKLGRCLACTTAAVAFKYTPSGAAPTTVFLAGSFNAWNSADAASKLTAQGNGDFTLSINLAPGTYEYKFVVDGNWVRDSANPRTVDDHTGGLNSVAVTNCHGLVPPECTSDQGCTGGKICKDFACTAPECVIKQDCGNVDLACGAGHCVTATCNHTFTYAGTATTVYVAGDFTNPVWDAMSSGWNLTQTSANVWSGTFPLKAGPHEYKLVLDGNNWILDPANPAQQNTNSLVADSCAVPAGGSGGSGGSTGSGGSGG